MKYTTLLCPLLCSTLLLLLLFSCHDDDGEELAERQERMAAITFEVETMIADKSCNGAGDCASIAFGAKPCGGPRVYLVYAPSNVDETKLVELVEEFNQLDHEVNQITGVGSDCALVEEPELICADGVCRAKE